MHKASWVFVLAVSLLLTAGCKKDELRAKDARIAELESQGEATGTSLEQCKKDRENLNKLAKHKLPSGSRSTIRCSSSSSR
jgi:hypothetical protein